MVLQSGIAVFAYARTRSGSVVVERCQELKFSKLSLKRPILTSAEISD